MGRIGGRDRAGQDPTPSTGGHGRQEEDGGRVRRRRCAGQPRSVEVARGAWTGVGDARWAQGHARVVARRRGRTGVEFARHAL